MPVDRQIRVDPIQALGIFANAFRVVDEEAGADQCLLEFLVYSQNEDLARVVGRVLVSKGLLLAIRDEIKEVL